MRKRVKALNIPRMIKVYRKELLNLNNKELNSFILKNKGLIFHEPEFNLIVSEFYNTSLFYWIAYEQNEMVGLCPGHLIKRKMLNQIHSNPTIFEIPYGGWVYNRSKISLTELLDSLSLKLNESLSYWTSFEDSKEIKKEEYYMKKETAIINLKESKDDILQHVISKNTRHNIRRAKKKGVSFKALNITNFEEFEELSDSLKLNLDMVLPEKGFYKKLFDYYHNDNKISALVAIFNDKNISGLLTIGNENCMHAWIAGRIKELPKNIYQNELLWWESIKWAKSIGSGKYDLCVIEKEQLPGIAQFKLGFSKNLVSFYHLPIRPIPYRVLNRILP